MSKRTLSQLTKNLDEVLSEVIWCEEGKLTSLAEKLSIPSKDGNPKTFEDLSIRDLKGAFAHLQIKYELFAERAEDYSKKDLAIRLKNLIFAQVKYNMQLRVAKKAA